MKLRAIILGALVVAVSACGAADSDDAGESAAAATGAHARFPNYIDQEPSGYRGSRFELSQDYPACEPPETLPWRSINPKFNTKDFLRSVRDYCFEGFIKPQTSSYVGRDFLDEDFRADKNTVRAWYHMPFLHVGKHPRESIHGMTREADAKPGRYADTQKRTQQNWGTAYFNGKAAFAIGKMWSEGFPKAGGAGGIQFPIGSVVFKLLFTEDPTDVGSDPTPGVREAYDVPWLRDSPRWNVNINESLTGDFLGQKRVRPMRIVQMDVSIKVDLATSPTGWIYGSLVYNNRAPLDGPNDKAWGPWARLMPVGLSVGNDPDVAPPAPGENAALRESFFSSDVPNATQSLSRFGMDFHGLGVGGRVNGPGDSPRSSCMACHSLARWTPSGGDNLFDLVPPKDLAATTSGWPELRKWFQNYAPPSQVYKPTSETAYSVDTSLQMMISLYNYKNRNLVPPGRESAPPVVAASAPPQPAACAR